ncbi:hypothetical protein [Cytobacillus praedii]|uniref:hypothetical protein n=1 Tax=Cytobacillus praedii TaxID=1742358 RepID=UPI002E1FA477|nr:hypothetical protein [Cytobacillus praedii]
MGKYFAQAAFDQLAVELKEKIAGVLLTSNLPEEEQKRTMKEADLLIKNWRREHNYALDTYYGTDRTRNIKGALKNDLRNRGTEK